jgi:hypothetical protein
MGLTGTAFWTGLGDNSIAAVRLHEPNGAGMLEMENNRGKLVSPSPFGDDAAWLRSVLAVRPPPVGWE